MLPGNQILESLELLAKVEFVDDSVLQNNRSVNEQFSIERQGLSVQEYLQQNRELYDVDGVKQRFSIKLRGSHWLPRNFAYDIVCTLMWG